MGRNQKSLSVEQSKPRPAAKPYKKTTFNVPFDEDRSDKKIAMWKIVMALVCLIIAAYFGYMGYLETRVNSPFEGPKVVAKSGLDIPELYWGSYRPGVYFGMKTRDPDSLVTGLMWYFPKKLRPDGSGIRHWCEQGDNLDRYTWTDHDGKTFGVQEIQDGPALITTSFVKRLGGNHGGDWTARISVDAKDNQTKGELVSLLFYTATDEKTKGWIRPTNSGKRLVTGIVGETSGLGSFSIKIVNTTGAIDKVSFLSTVAGGLHVLSQTVLASLRLVADKKNPNRKEIVLPGEVLPRTEDGETPLPNFVVTQITGKVPLEIDIIFESGSSVDRFETLTGNAFSNELKERKNDFNHKFEEIFKLESKGYNAEAIDFAKSAFSNLLGGVGYFYGAPRVESPYTSGPVPYWKAPLYSAVPSRSFFPRGFLWDEGFHGLLISAWDVDIELDILSHWFDLMNIEGWIPREVILGSEALSKVPEEFVTQRNTNANPPSFFLTLQYILQNYGNDLVYEVGRLSTLERLFPRLQTWFEWFNVTQSGDMPGTYRWRGRDSLTTREINPKTLTSGLDDYPRASHPNMDERHIDLRCWIALSASILSDMAKLLNRDGRKYTSTLKYLSDTSLLDELHWSPQTQSYADYGLHTDAVILRRPPPRPHAPGQQPQNADKVRVVLEDPELRFIDSSFGYISLFPFLLRLIEPNSPKLGKLLDDIKRPELLWTKFGLRSLAKTAPLFMKYNTEHDPPYWRGYIWMNVNYLAVRSLNHYSKVEGPYQAKASGIYKELRKNLITNVLREYRRTGYIWENYSEDTGAGHGCRPFTGWSSLVVMLMAELY